MFILLSLLFHLDFTTTTTDVFTTEVIPSSDLSGSSWNRYVYRVYNGSHVDQDRCTAMCAFDFPNAAGSKCGFVVLDSDVCYLGSLNDETDVLATPVVGVDLQLKTCKMYYIACKLRAALGEARFLFRWRCCLGCILGWGRADLFGGSRLQSFAAVFRSL